jgi:hypothetical protein
MKFVHIHYKKKSSIHPWNWDDFNAKNLWSWQLGNASMPM